MMQKSSTWGAIWHIQIDYGTHKENNSKNTRKSSPPAAKTWGIFWLAVPGLKNNRTPISLKAAFRHLSQSSSKTPKNHPQRYFLGAGGRGL